MMSWTRVESSSFNIFPAHGKKYKLIDILPLRVKINIRHLKTRNKNSVCQGIEYTLLLTLKTTLFP